MGTFYRINIIRNIGLVTIIMVSAVATFTLPVIERLRSNLGLPLIEESEMISSEAQQQEDNAHFTEMFSEDEEDKSRDWPIPDFLANILPSSIPYLSSQAEATETQVAPNSTSPSSPSSSSFSLLQRLFPKLIIERPSLFRVQFYNSDYEDSSQSPDDENSTMPRTVFGSPLCLGLCVPIQVFAENSSIKVLSNRKISLLPLRRKPKPQNPDPTPLSPPATLLPPFNPSPSNTKVIINITRSYNQQSSPYGIAINAPENVPTNIIIKAQNEDQFQQKYNLSTTPPPPITSESAESESITEASAFEWLPSWIITPPSLSKIQDSIQLPVFPNISVYDLVG